MISSKINAFDFRVGGMYSGDQAVAEYDLAFPWLDESRRIRVVDFAQHVVALACKLWRQSAVILIGVVVADRCPEREQQRANLTPPHPGGVLKSMQELLRRDSRTGMELAAENGNHVITLPIFDEMRTLLDLWHKAWYGYQCECDYALTVTVSELCSQTNGWTVALEVGSGSMDTNLPLSKIIKCRLQCVKPWQFFQCLCAVASKRSLEFLSDLKTIAIIESSQEVGAYVETF